MKKLSEKPEGHKHVPKIYDVLVHEYLEWSSEDPVYKPTVFIVMEYFPMDLRDFLENNIKNLDEKQVLQII